ncbi:MAG: hypothetical protein E2O84_00115, partial [Bacteroidetes bacterium]
FCADGEHAIQCPIRFWAEEDPEALAIRLVGEHRDIGSVVADLDMTFTYGQLDWQISGARSILQKAEQDRNSLVGIVAGNPVQVIVILFACLRERIPLVLFSNRVPRAAIQHAIDRHHISAMVNWPEVDPCGDDGGGSSIFRRGDGAPAVRPSFRVVPTGHSKRTGQTREAGFSATTTASGEADLSIDGLATMIFTSGSTAQPRLAVHSVGNHLSAARAACSFAPLPRTANWLLSLDLNHVGGLAIVFRSFGSGASISVSDNGWSPASVFESGVTHASLVPAQLNMLLNHLEKADKMLSGCGVQLLIGGAAAGTSRVREALKAGFLIRTTYGLTEFSSQVATSELWRIGNDVPSPLFLLDHVEALVDGNELLLRGPSLFLGYLENGHLVDTRNEDGFFATGDQASLTDSALIINGRVDFMFISGGENIHPSAIELQLMELDGVTRAAVVPIRDDVFGNRPAAFLEMKVGSIPQARIEASLRVVLPGFMIPVHFFPWPSETGEKEFKFSRQKLMHLAQQLQHNAD